MITILYILCRVMIPDFLSQHQLLALGQRQRPVFSPLSSPRPSSLRQPHTALGQSDCIPTKGDTSHCQAWLLKTRGAWWSRSWDFALPKQGAWVRSLVGEVRLHMPHSQKINTFINILKKKTCSATPYTFYLFIPAASMCPNRLRYEVDHAPQTTAHSPWMRKKIKLNLS